MVELDGVAPAEPHHRRGDGCGALFLFLPLVVVVLFSFHETAGLFFPFQGFSLRWYRAVWASEDFRSAALNSLWVALPVAGLTLILGTLAAYGLSRSPSRLRARSRFFSSSRSHSPGSFLASLCSSSSPASTSTSRYKTVVMAHLVYVFPYFLLMAVAASTVSTPLSKRRLPTSGPAR